MTDHSTQPADLPAPGRATADPVAGAHQPSAPYAQQVAAYGPPPYPMAGPAPVGKIRSTGLCILLSVVTFGIYSLVWYYSVHEEMKRHTRNGIGGGLALLLGLLVGFVMPYLTSSEVGQLYAARGMRRPVSGVTGLWYLPGAFILVGPLVWFIKTNGALNAYWRSCGATQ